MMQANLEVSIMVSLTKIHKDLSIGIWIIEEIKGVMNCLCFLFCTALEVHLCYQVHINISNNMLFLHQKR